LKGTPELSTDSASEVPNDGRTVSLDALQRWMQAVITHPGGVAAGAASAEARVEIERADGDLEQVVNRSQSLSALQRLEIYNHSYFARLLECMRSEYSVLATALGEELFDDFALGYLQSHPPHSATLADLGYRFPEYLAATRPAADHAGESRPDSHLSDWPRFLIDLARLEQAINMVFDGPGSEGERLVDSDRLAAVPSDRWPGARLVCVPSLKLLTLSFPVNDYFTAIRRGETTEIPERAPSYLAIVRSDYRVFRHGLDAMQFELLRALSEGETVESAIARGVTPSPMPDDEIAGILRDWFFAWTTAGFFRDVVV
jgi:hypothetical protein